MCRILVIVFISLFVSDNVDTTTKEVKCPEFCDCDLFESFRRAVCQRKRLYSVELNIPPEAQILDLSFNQISSLEDRIFLQIGLTNLKLLNISHNKIGQIHFNGFEGLENLKTLDLSFNFIQYFTKSWFVSLSSLQELYLRGNKLKSINEEPLLEIAGLKVLDLGKCGITHLRPDIFSLVPKLEVLDISENYLQKLVLAVVQPLTELKVLKVLDNNFNCKNGSLMQIRNYTKSLGISYKDPCIIDMMTSFNINNRPQKFEKIIMSEEKDDGFTEKNSWIFDDEELKKGKIVEVCSNGTSGDKREKEIATKSFLMQIIELSPWLVITLTFLYGLFLGMVIGCAIKVKCKRSFEDVEINVPDGSINYRSMNSTTERSFRRDRARSGDNFLMSTLQRVRRQTARNSGLDADESLVLSEFQLANTTPVQTRKNLIN